MASQPGGVGTLYLRLNGVQQSLMGSWKIQPNLLQKKPREGQSGPLDPTVKFVTPYIKGELDDNGSVSVQALQSFTGTVTAELRNGKTYTLSGAYWGDDAEIDTEGGKIQVSFYGKSCQEVLAS